MATKTAGGVITGTVALTCEASVALNAGDWVHVTGPYTVALADGTKTPIGYVVTKNVHRVNGVYPTAQTPGDVAIEARGTGVCRKAAGAAIAAGADVGIGAAGALLTVGAGVSRIGVALTAAAAAGDLIDVLIQP